ncbi:hypothetical protein BGW36DRAFT_296432, partial [Talaromyces proteolyticus]
WKEAEELFVQVIETRKRVLGGEHSSTLTSMANLASCHAPGPTLVVTGCVEERYDVLNHTEIP